jgi:hypothetical protein
VANSYQLSTVKGMTGADEEWQNPVFEKKDVADRRL